MKLILFFCLKCFITQIPIWAELPNNKINDKEQISATNDLDELVSLLSELERITNNSYLKLSCRSILDVLESKPITEYEQTFITQIYNTFGDTRVMYNASDFDSYINRKRPLIISWTSPTDGTKSMAWVLLPENWDSTKSYPLYVTLHGLSSIYTDPIQYMSRYLSPESIMERSFEDGYILFPWGRGNIWYEGIGETDIWECIDAMENNFKIDSTRKCLMGFSMGGYGAWVIGQKSPDIWAAIGVHAGALWYSGNQYLNAEAAEKLKDVPVYISVGTKDGLYNDNITAYNLLLAAGNPNIVFETFDGGHEAPLEIWVKMYDWVRQFKKESETNVVADNELTGYELLNNYPNPFNPVTNIEFSLPRGNTAVLVQLKIFDSLGKQIDFPVNKELSPGNYNVQFDGSKLTSGIYYYILSANGNTICKKMCLMK